MTDIRKQLLAAFEVEHREHLHAIRKALDAAESGAPLDMADVFRRAHSLKGAARAVDLPAVEEVAHQLEALFSRILEGSQSLDPETVVAVRGNLDAIEDLVAEAQHPSGTAAVAAAKARRTPSTEDGAGASDCAPTEAKGAAPDKAEQGSDPGAGTYLRVAAAQVEELAGSMHQLLAELQADEAMSESLRQVELDVRNLRRSWDALQRQFLSGASKAAGGKASTARLRDFDQELKGLFRKLSSLARSHKLSAWATEQAARQLRENIERVSLVSAETVFGTFGHMVREIAREEGRNVHFRTLGLDIQADRQVLQALKDPVMHLLRNAVSHGAEDGPERAAKGKPERTEIVLELTSRNGRLAVSVRDDGRGPDLARIERVAVERGLLQPRAAGDPAPMMDQLLSLVFSPGFSTAGSVDRLSGRGMGLSVVAEAVRRLHGSVLLRPRYPWGTEALLSVPFSAARQPLLLVEAEGRMFGLPTHGVERLLRLNARALESVEGRPAARIDVRGQDVIVPVVALAALTGSPNAPIPIEAGHAKAVLVRHGARHCALAVNAFHDVRTMLVNEVQAIGLGETVSGTVLLEDELPALVLSPELLVEHWVRHEGRLAAGGLGLAEWKPEAEEHGATVLVVDDSITTRTLEKSILEAQGYRVLLSVDGIDALNVLRSGEAMVDLVIADVEMPRMDGFGLLQAIKTDPRLAAVPVILMTSRADPADVRRGLDLGASAYITKQKFDQRELLATIGQLL
ncbi:hybrid sensor histidine kinase/response regulator [Microvirga thermotolerans]|uniref:Chemotaxis protein CheA n=1 Tax=Microvirga thermotolerans TaxID=2651334 RepID=A0A5P9JRP8_9HYPH|nr:response regulator [Microvirga thermotolerans]QFU15287.1 response regulator [Microvirga thermotolerans]